MTEPQQALIDGVEGPPCVDCIHVEVCSIREHYSAFMFAMGPALDATKTLPTALHPRGSVDCDHFLTRAVAIEEFTVTPARPFVPMDVDEVERAGSGDWLADAVRDHERSQTEEDVDSEPDEAPVFNDPAVSLNDADATDEAPALHEAAPDVTPVAVKRSRPIGAPTVVCDPGCGETILQAAIGEHRRMCPEVLAFKAARGVTQLPDRYLEPAAEAPTSDFAARRDQAARDAAARTWDRSHPEGDAPAVAPVVAAPSGGRPLAGQERRVLASALRHKGDRRAVAAELGIHAKTVESTLEHVGQKGHLPIELIQTLPARFAKYARVPA